LSQTAGAEEQQEPKRLFVLSRSPASPGVCVRETRETPRAGKARDAAQSPELKKLIEQAKPVIQRHLKQAEQIHGKFTRPAA